MFPILAARETYVAETNLFSRKQENVLPQAKNIFASRKQILLPKHVFPSLATMVAKLSSFQCCSLKLSPSNRTLFCYRRLHLSVNM